MASSPDQGDDGVEHLLDGGGAVHVVGGRLACIDDEVSDEREDDEFEAVRDCRKGVRGLVQVPSLHKGDVLGLG